MKTSDRVLLTATTILALLPLGTMSVVSEASQPMVGFIQQAAEAGVNTEHTRTPDRSSVDTALHSAPVMFIENVGQFAADARFQVHGGNHTL